LGALSSGGDISNNREDTSAEARTVRDGARTRAPKDAGKHEQPRLLGFGKGGRTL
jgi:hypothetical protein